MAKILLLSSRKTSLSKETGKTEFRHIVPGLFSWSGGSFLLCSTTAPLALSVPDSSGAVPEATPCLISSPLPQINSTGSSSPPRGALPTAALASNSRIHCRTKRTARCCDYPTPPTSPLSQRCSRRSRRSHRWRQVPSRWSSESVPSGTPAAKRAA